MADQIALRLAETQVAAGSAVAVTANFRTRSTGVASTPSSVRYRVDCLTSHRNVINWTSVSAASSVTIDVGGPYNAIIDENNDYETRQITVEIDTGLTTQSRQSVQWRVRNIRTYVPSASFRDDLLLEPYYPINSAETAAGFVEADDLAPSYYYGDVRRYLGVEGADISTALQAAIDSSDDVTIPLESCSAGAVNLRTGVRIRGLGKDRTTITRVGTSSIFQNSAATTDNAISDLTLDANSSYTNPVCNFVVGTNGFRGERIRFINFDSGSSACAGMQWQTSSSTTSHDIYLRDLEFDNSSGTATANYNSLLFYNARGVHVLDSLFMNSGDIAFATGGSFVGATGDIVVSGNIFRGVDSTVVLVRCNSACLLENVHLSHNDFYDCSPTLGKYCLTIQQAPATTGGLFRNINVLGNNARCRGDECEGFLAVSCTGASAVNGISVVGNTFDCTDSSGAAITTGNADQRGIWVFGDSTNLATNVSIIGNTIRGTQSFGIGINSATGWTIAGNTCDTCVTNSASGGVAIESSIYVPQGVTRYGAIVGNTVRNSGGGGATQSGIGSASSANISDITVSGNTCVDDRGGSAAMVYGFNFGAAATGIQWGANYSVGHTTAQVNPASPGVVAYTVTNHTVDRTFDANASSTAELADVAGSILLDLSNRRFITASIS